MVRHQDYVSMTRSHISSRPRRAHPAARALTYSVGRTLNTQAEHPHRNERRGEIFVQLLEVVFITQCLIELLRDRLARIRQAIGPGQRAGEGARVRSWHAGRGAADLDVAHVEHLQGCDVQVDRANAGLAARGLWLPKLDVRLRELDVAIFKKIGDRRSVYPGSPRR